MLYNGETGDLTIITGHYGYKPPLPHEYQLLFSTKEAHLAFDRMVAFLAAHAK